MTSKVVTHSRLWDLHASSMTVDLASSRMGSWKRIEQPECDKNRYCHPGSNAAESNDIFGSAYPESNDIDIAYINYVILCQMRILNCTKIAAEFDLFDD